MFLRPKNSTNTSTGRLLLLSSLLLLFYFLVFTEAFVLNCTEDTLYNWCYSDVECRKLFHQHDHKNIDTFKYVLKTCLNEHELQKSYDNWSDDSKKHIWLTNMKLWAYRTQNGIHCPANKKLIYKNGKPLCVCKPDRSCDDSEETEPFLWVVACTTLLLLVVLFIGSCCCKDKWPPMPLQAFPPHLQYESHHYQYSQEQTKIQTQKQKNEGQEQQMQQQQTENRFNPTNTRINNNNKNNNKININNNNLLSAAEALKYYKINK